jgi:hypothetical protein
VDQASGETPKLHIDEDWKSQAQAEKERLERSKAAGNQAEPVGAQTGPPSQPAPPASPAAGPAEQQAAEHRAADHQRQLPPATLAVLITTLATQAMMLLGQIPNPLWGKAEIDLPQAQHFIDTLAMLEAKTAGNRTPDETRLLDTVLHELRMAFVQVSRPR